MGPFRRYRHNSSCPPSKCAAYMATATPRHEPASEANWAVNAGAECIAPARSKSAAACMSSAADRGATSQPPHAPLSTVARMVNALASFGAALTTLADSALSHQARAGGGLGRRGPSDTVGVALAGPCQPKVAVKPRVIKKKTHQSDKSQSKTLTLTRLTFRSIISPTSPLPGFGTSLRHGRIRPSAPEHGTGPQPDRSAQPPP